MRIYEILTEKVSDIVYHATNFKSAKNILSSNLLKSVNGYISFTRSLTGSYHTSNRIIGIIFEVDGSKLNNLYKGYPVGTEQWSINDDTVAHHGRANKQLEDRLIAPNGIKNFISYVKNVIIFMPYEYMQNSDRNEFDEVYEDDFKYFDDVLALLENNNIQYRVVSTESELYTRGKPTSIDAKPLAKNKKHSSPMYRIFIGIYDENTDTEKVRHFDVYANTIEIAEIHGEKLVNNLSHRYEPMEVYLKKVQQA